MTRAFTTETKRQKLMAIYTHRVEILSAQHMLSLPVTGYCRIEMVGGEALHECIGEFHFNLLARTLHWLQGVDGELTRRTYLLDIFRHLGRWDIAALEEHCFLCLRLPSAPPKRPSKRRYDPMARLGDRSPLTYVAHAAQS